MKDIITEFYAQDIDTEVQSAMSRTISVVLEVDDVAMLRAISERFKQSMSGLGSQILSKAVSDAFNALNAKDQDQLAKKADAESQEYLSARGFKFPKNEPHKHWQIIRDSNAHLAKTGDKK